MVFLVSYDLNSDNNNNAQVRELIGQLGSANQCLESSWLLDTDIKNAGLVYEALQPAMKPGDRFFICPVTYDTCAGRTSSLYNVWEWFKVHPK